MTSDELVVTLVFDVPEGGTLAPDDLTEIIRSGADAIAEAIRRRSRSHATRYVEGEWVLGNDARGTEYICHVDP